MLDFWRRKSVAGLLALLPLALASVGCGSGKSGTTLDSLVKGVLKPRLTPQQHMLVAVSDSDADLRRDAIARVAASKQHDADWAVKGLCAVALLETDPQVRCAAIRGLGQSRDARAVEALLKLLNFRDFPPREVRPPEDECRWDALAGLGLLSKANVVPAESQPTAAEMLQVALKRDSFWPARVAAAQALVSYPSAETLQALLLGLADENFTVAYESDRALTALTGAAPGGSALAWQQWLAEHPDNVFAHRGEIPPGKEPPYTNQVGKAVYDTRQFFWWLFPGRKE